MSISGGETITPSPPRHVSLRVKPNVAPNSTEIIRRPALSPDRSENVAMEFERGIGRFPEKVSHIQGSTAYGCDILIFHTNEDLQRFLANPDTRLIERFIEVKGSVNSDGEVTLKDNELRSAQLNRERYFLYRIYESDEAGKV